MHYALTGIHTQNKNDAFDLAGIHDLVRLALRDSGISISKGNSRNFGIFLGTTYSNYHIRKENADKYAAQGVRVINPADFPRCLVSYLAGAVATALSIKGANSTISSGVSSGMDALAQALSFLRRDAHNKAVVLELSEEARSQDTVSVVGSTCLIMENARCAHKSPYALIGALEARFEEKGQSKGLKEALKRIVAKHSLASQDLQYCFEPVIATRQDMSLRKCLPGNWPALSLSGHGCSGLEQRGLSYIVQSICDVSFYQQKNSKYPAVLFFVLGENSNSSCLLIKRKENTYEKKRIKR